MGTFRGKRRQGKSYRNYQRERRPKGPGKRARYMDDPGCEPFEFFENPLPTEEPLPVTDSRVRLDPDDYFDECVQRDYAKMQKIPLATDDELKDLILLQSMVGHANQGHCEFRGYRYPNVTAEDILKSLRRSWKGYWDARQTRIDDVRVYVERAVRDPSDPRVRRLYSSDGERPIGAKCHIEELSGEEEVRKALAAFVFTTAMDDYSHDESSWRRRVRKKHGIDLGGGLCCAINMVNLRNEGMTLETLSTNEHDADAFADLIERKIIVDKSLVYTSSINRNGYVRIQKGKGVSDDAAIVLSGICFGDSGFQLGMVGDYLDTMDKSTAMIVKGGQDAALGEFVWEETQQRGIDLGITEEQIVDMINLSAIDPQRPTLWVHCSQRYFYQQLDSVNCAADMHYTFSQKMRGCKNFKDAADVAEKMPNKVISFGKRDSKDFYGAIVERLETAQNNGTFKIF